MLFVNSNVAIQSIGQLLIQTIERQPNLYHISYEIVV